MTTVVVGEHPEVESWLAERRALGLDRLPTFNLGTGPQDYRVPDAGWVPTGTQLQLYRPTAAVVLEVRSPGDETDAKIGWYDMRSVREVLVADPVETAGGSRHRLTNLTN